MASFQIADCPTSLALTETGLEGRRIRQGKLSLTVRNVSSAPQTARIFVEPSEGANVSWFAIEGTPATGSHLLERDFDPKSTQTISVVVTVPTDVAAKTYGFRVR